MNPKTYKNIIILSITILFITASPRVIAQDLNTEALDSLLQASVDQGFNGAALVIVYGDTPVYFNGAGAIEPDSRRPVGSGSKWIASGVLMQLIDQGLVSLDDRISNYYESFTGDKEEITVRQCWSHTAGFPTDSWILTSGIMNLQEAADSIGVRVDLIHTPGEVFHYGGISMHVGGAVCELVTETRWEVLFQEGLALDCEIENATWGPADLNPRIAAGLEISANDFARFLSMILNRGMFGDTQVLSPEAVDTMLINQMGNPEIGYTPNWGDYDSFEYGLGNWTGYEVEGEDTLEVENMSPGVWGCIPWINFERNYAAVFMTVDTLDASWPWFYQIRDVIHESYLEVEEREAFISLPFDPIIQATYPNPFNSTVNLDVYLYSPGMIKLEIIDINGRQVSTIHQGWMNPGNHLFDLNSANLTSGTYFARLGSGEFSTTRQIILLK